MKKYKPLTEKQLQQRRDYYHNVVKPRRDAVTHRLWLNQLSTNELEQELKSRKQDDTKNY